MDLRRVVVVFVILVATIGGILWEQRRARIAAMIRCEEKIDPIPAGCGCFEGPP
jgi:hypothetical protein